MLVLSNSTLKFTVPQFMSHDYSEQSTTEDPQMLAFFDSLIQRARDGSTSDSDDVSSDDNIVCNTPNDLADVDYSSLSDDYRKCTYIVRRQGSI